MGTGDWRTVRSLKRVPVETKASSLIGSSFAVAAVAELEGVVCARAAEARRARIERFLAKRDKRVWTKKVKYDVRKNFADSRLRVKVRVWCGVVWCGVVCVCLSIVL